MAWELYKNQYGRRFRWLSAADAAAELAAGTIKRLINGSLWIYVQHSIINAQSPEMMHVTAWAIAIVLHFYPATDVIAMQSPYRMPTKKRIGQRDFMGRCVDDDLRGLVHSTSPHATSLPPCTALD